MLTNLRQQSHVQSALGGVAAATSSVQSGIPHEMVLLDLYQALRALDETDRRNYGRRHSAPDIFHILHRKIGIGDRERK